MFLPVAEKMGLLDYLAPRRRNRKNSKAKKEKKNEPDDEKEEVEDDAVGTDEKPPEPPQRSKEEVEARARGHFVKKQKVRYLHKATDTWHDAVIVGVHFDDGPDKPYYVSSSQLHLFALFLFRLRSL